MHDAAPASRVRDAGAAARSRQIDAMPANADFGFAAQLGRPVAAAVTASISATRTPQPADSKVASYAAFLAGDFYH
jgi:hypothetical protein